MHAFEREASRSSRVARRLEDPDVTPKDYDKLRAHHARSAIVGRLRQDFAEKHVTLAHLDNLHERIGLLSKHWYRQGGMILDRVEALRVRLAIYEWRLSKIAAGSCSGWSVSARGARTPGGSCRSRGSAPRMTMPRTSSASCSS